MEDFNASLVREKIIFDDATSGNKESIIIKSNRIFLSLADKGGKTEKIVVRTQNMHTTLLMAAKIMFSFYRNGHLMTRSTPFDWEAQWDTVLLNYEREFNPDIWAAIYVDGKNVFKTKTSPFVDVIEKCALLTIDNYDATMEVTESALKQVGHAMRINHMSKVAAVFHDGQSTLKCGIIHREDGHDTTFNFTATGGETHNRVVQSLNVAAAFLEAINLRHVTRSLKSSLRKHEIKQISKGENQLRSATSRMAALDKMIRTFDDMYGVQYRPEKPKFFGDA